MKLNEEIKNEILKFVRDNIEYYIVNKVSKPNFLDKYDELRKNLGVFVTLKKEKKLRGCIGLIEGLKPLYEAIEEMSISAAFNDPRFSPVELDELDNIEIEVSILTKPEIISNYKNIKLGIDGIILSYGFKKAVFLPQVATEQGWDLDTTLQYLCMKGGMPKDQYKKEIDIEVFQAIVFGEKNDM